jgi:hypothetical protein
MVNRFSCHKRISIGALEQLFGRNYQAAVLAVPHLLSSRGRRALM